jgi:alkylhydroperoxidase family enzyme
VAHIPQVDAALASAEQRAAEAEELRLRGRMTNMKRTLLHSPAALRVYGEWFTLRDQLRPVIEDRAIWLFAHAISVASRSLIGTTFMRRALAQSGIDPDRLQLSEEERELVDFGSALGAGPRAVPAEVWGPLRARYADRTLVDLVAFAGIMVATNVFTDVIETPLDDELETFVGGR